MKKIFFIIILTLLFAAGMHAQMPKEEAEATPNYTQALEAVQSGNDIDRATSLLEKEIKTNPTNGYAALLLGRIYLLNENNVGAISSLTKAAKALPKGDKESLVGCYMAKGLAYTFMNDNSNALKCFEQAKKTDPKAGGPYLVIAQIYEEQGDSAKAAQTLADALKADPTNAEIHEELGKRAANAERHKEAIEHFSMAIAANPTNEDYLVERAVEYLQTDNAGCGADDLLDAFQYWISGGMQGGEKIEAVLSIFIEYEHKTLLSKIQERNVDEESFIWNILERAVYGKIPDRKAALVYFQNLYEKEGASVGLRLAQAYYDNGLYSKALEVIEANKDASEEDDDYLNLEIKVLQGLGEKEKLMRVLNANFPDNDGGSFPYIIRTAEEYYDGNMEAALAAIDKALEFDDMKEKSKALLFRGVILKCMEREDEAKKEFNRVLKMAEEGEEVEERDIMLVNAYLGNSEQVEEIIGKSDTDDNDDLRAMAQTRAIQGQYDKALLYLELLKENGYPHYKSLGRDPVFQPMKDMADYQQLMAAWKAVVGE